jgi:hypothetical protein
MHVRRAVVLAVTLSACRADVAAPAQAVDPPRVDETAPAAPVATGEVIAVAMPDDEAEITLFLEERLELRAAIAASLAREGHSIVPVADLERIESAAEKGVLELEGGQQCRAALTRAEVQRRYYRDKRIARTSATCDDGCRLSVTLEAAEGMADPDIVWEATDVHPPEDPRSWISAAQKLRTTDRRGTKLGGLRADSGPDMMFLSPRKVGPWAEAPDQRVFSDLEPALESCEVPGLGELVVHDLRAAVGPSGAITRCEADLGATAPLAGPDLGECMCNVVRQVKLAPGPAGRRFHIPVVQRTNRFRPPVSVKMTSEQPGAEDWIERVSRSEVLERCLADARPDTTATFTIELPLAEDGSVGKVRIDGEIGTDKNAGFAECLTRDLPKVELPCRPRGITELRLKTELFVSTP